MSRQILAGKAGATSVAIGWDRPLDTFFVQIFHPDPDEAGEETTFMWIGTASGELPTAAAAIKIAALYANLPQNFSATLETDRLRTLGTSDSERQIAIKKRLFGT